MIDEGGVVEWTRIQNHKCGKETRNLGRETPARCRRDGTLDETEVENCGKGFED